MLMTLPGHPQPCILPDEDPEMVPAMRRRAQEAPHLQQVLGQVQHPEILLIPEPALLQRRHRRTHLPDGRQLPPQPRITASIDAAQKIPGGKGQFHASSDIRQSLPAAEPGRADWWQGKKSEALLRPASLRPEQGARRIHPTGREVLS
jgi:hypothetical protein